MAHLTAVFQEGKTPQEGQGEHKLDYDREIPVCIRISSSKEVEPALPKPMYSSWKNFFSLNLVIFTLFWSIFIILIDGSPLREVIYILDIILSS